MIHRHLVLMFIIDIVVEKEFRQIRPFVHQLHQSIEVAVEVTVNRVSLQSNVLKFVKLLRVSKAMRHNQLNLPHDHHPFHQLHR